MNSLLNFIINLKWKNSTHYIQGTHCTGIWKFCQNTGKTQGICFAPVVNSLILKVTDISKIFAKDSYFFGSWISLQSQFSVCNSHKSQKLAQGKFDAHREKTGKTGNLKMQFKWVPCNFLNPFPTHFSFGKHCVFMCVYGL